MSKLIKKLQECTTLSAADPILKKLRASPTARKLVETSILLRMSGDPVQRAHGEDFLNTAIKELEPYEEPAEPEAPGIKTKGDHFVQEELLDNHNPSDGNTGSESSTDNTEPYPGEGTDAPNSDIESMQTSSGEDQMKENIIPGMMPGMMPPMQNGMSMMDPSIANQMGNQMPKMPPMSTPQQMQQMQYTIKQYHNTVVKPALKENKIMREAIKKLSYQLREVEAKSGGMSVNINEYKSRKQFPRVQETQRSDVPLMYQPTGRQSSKDLLTARNEIQLMDQQLRENE